MNRIIKIAEDFSVTPGARYKTDGPFSGEAFFEEILDGAFKELKEEDKLIIILDQTDGYATSFLDESFGLLLEKYGLNNVLKKLVFISEEEPSLIDEIKEYMDER